MSGAIPSGQNQVFQDRLKRIEQARAPDLADLLDAEGNPVPDRTQVSPLPDWKQNLRYPALLVAAAMAGMLGVFVARFVRFHLTGGTLAGGEAADLTMLIDGGLAAMASFLVFSLLRFDGKDLKAAQTVGVAIMICTMHNLVHAAPRVFDAVFSPAWTAEVMEATQPKSILFRGVSFVVVPEEEPEQPEQPEKKLPTIRRMG